MGGVRERTFPSKNSSSSLSVMSKVKLPINAVKGGSVGRGRSSRMGPAPRSASEVGWSGLGIGRD